MSGQVRLRDVEHVDLEEFFAHEHDPEAVRRSKFPPREREAFMTHWTTRVLGDPTVLAQAVTVDGELVGNVVAWWGEGRRRFVGYWLGRRYWGRGIGTRALALFLERERTRPLYADPFIGNTGSVRLLEEHGFRRTGTVRYGEHEHIVLVLDENAA
ncbi:GNAT family N-acetyltransferase [Streptomyces somaliensis DSM 40738]|uniref:GNAT family N-acetyltransferase n=1 Tax=Streptomyces somaliensis (strain ATCC 33201 / DSM 40738 / JCM 12659 / KCTC 9044 / NCTC 11332 / NRRL B-12077 / IP 733) TaxID=1134445 RepID=A0AA44IE69_STRE0|nr:GNAT family protein [Streptomyces somaliensis]MCQ0024663.1 GNAT family N-acetyltransferase [Streptomyces somaliensis DSM 40738]NKY15351.1 GNAT family N-acetyltransferase [Streptomyces somaliensis DSM 40738]